MAPLRVAAITSGPNVPSSRFRVRQHIEVLAQEGIEVTEHPCPIDKFAPVPASWPRRPVPLRMASTATWLGYKTALRVPAVAASHRADVTWLERELLAGFCTLEPLLGRPLVLDVDDAIWASHPNAPRAAARIAGLARTVIVGNAFLAEWFRQHAADVRIVPTAIDDERFTPRANPRPEDAPFVVGWTGIAANFEYLDAVGEGLGAFLRDRRAELLVVADRAPDFAWAPRGQVRYVPWSPAIEASVLQGVDVGIMPLHTDDVYSRGKCSFKMIQYMATGLPVVVSDVGMNSEILRLADVGLGPTKASEWFDALDRLHRDAAERARLGANGRALVEQRFARRVVARQLGEILRDAAER